MTKWHVVRTLRYSASRVDVFVIVVLQHLRSVVNVYVLVFVRWFYRSPLQQYVKSKVKKVKLGYVIVRSKA